MITKIKMTLQPEKETERYQPEWTYRLYADYLKSISGEYAEKLHHDNITPISQFLKKEGSRIIWTVNLLGEEAEREISPVLMTKDVYHIRYEVRVTERECEVIEDSDMLFALAAANGKAHCLNFETAAAFKSQGRYINLPTLHLIIQNLVRKWNECFHEMQIEDTDGEGINYILSHLYCPQYHLHEKSYTIKGTCIHGFAGSMLIRNQLTGFHKELTDALLYFAGYSGMGIKTALGMGGVSHSFV